MTISRINGYNSVRRLNTRRVSAPAGGWWLAGGIDPSACVGAWQAKGAASLAASYVNLNSPGTYNATAGNGTVSFDTSTGWLFDTTNKQRLDIGYTGDVGALIVFAKATSTGGGGYGQYIHINATTMFWVHNALTTFTGNWDGAYPAGTVIRYYALDSDHTIAANLVPDTRVDVYFSGSDKSDFAKTAVAAADTFYIGNRPVDNIRVFGGYIYAVAVYNVGLSSAQMSALHSAISAL